MKSNFNGYEYDCWNSKRVIHFDAKLLYQTPWKKEYTLYRFIAYPNRTRSKATSCVLVYRVMQMHVHHLPSSGCLTCKLARLNNPPPFSMCISTTLLVSNNSVWEAFREDWYIYRWLYVKMQIINYFPSVSLYF